MVVVLVAIFVPFIEQVVPFDCPPYALCPFVLPVNSTVSLTFYIFRFGGVYYGNTVYQFRTTLYN